jgi:hypothetical protein
LLDELAEHVRAEVSSASFARLDRRLYARLLTARRVTVGHWDRERELDGPPARRVTARDTRPVVPKPTLKIDRPAGIQRSVAAAKQTHPDLRRRPTRSAHRWYSLRGRGIASTRRIGPRSPILRDPPGGDDRIRRHAHPASGDRNGDASNRGQRRTTSARPKGSAPIMDGAVAGRRQRLAVQGNRAPDGGGIGGHSLRETEGW